MFLWLIILRFNAINSYLGSGPALFKILGQMDISDLLLQDDAHIGTQSS